MTAPTNSTGRLSMPAVGTHVSDIERIPGIRARRSHIGSQALQLCNIGLFIRARSMAAISVPKPGVPHFPALGGMS